MGGGVWTREDLRTLRSTAHLSAAVFDLRAVAASMDRPAAEVNRALDALLGRSAAEAAAVLAEGPPRAPEPRGLRRFLAEMFG